MGLTYSDSKCLCHSCCERTRSASASSGGCSHAGILWGERILKYSGTIAFEDDRNDIR